MSANFLSLNTAKTEFLLIGQPRQFAKLDRAKISLLDNVTLSPAILVSYSILNFLLLNTYLLSLNHVIIISVISNVLGVPLISPQLVSLPLLLFTLNLTTVILFY
jgi:type III secretory pathway component EscR